MIKRKNTPKRKARDFLKTKTKEVVDYFPRGGGDFTFNTAVVDRKDKGEKFLKKKRKIVKDATPGLEDEDTLPEIEEALTKEGDSSNSRALNPKFCVGDLVLLTIAEIRKDYMIANYTRNKKAMIHTNYSGLNGTEDFSFEKYFKTGQFVCGAVVSPGNDIQLPVGYMNKKILVSIDPKIVNTGLTQGNLTVGMDLYGRLTRDENGVYSADFGFTDSEEEIIKFSQKVGKKKIFFEVEEDEEEGEEVEDNNDDNNDENEDEVEEESEEEFNIEKYTKKNKKRKFEKKENSKIEINLVDNQDSPHVFEDKILNSYYFFKLTNIENKNDKLILTVSLDHHKFKFPVKKCEYKFIRPGFMFKANETRELLNGIEVAYAGNIGSIFTDHLSDKAKNKNMLTRVIHVSVKKCAVSLSAKKHIINLEVEDIDKKRSLIGSLFEKVQVDKVLFGNAYQTKVGELSAFLHPSQVENREEKVFVPEETIEKVLVKEYNFFDDRAMLTNKKALLDHEFICWENIKIGKFVTGIINEIRNDAIYLKLNNYIEGKLPKEHISDYPLSKIPSKKYKIGQSLKVRVFAMDYSTKYLLLTTKESYMEQESILTGEYAQLREGDEINVVYIGNSLFQHSGSVIGKLMNFKKLSSKENFVTGKVYTYRVFKVNIKGKVNRLFLTNEDTVWQPGVGDYENIVRRNSLLNTICSVLNFNVQEGEDLQPGNVYDFTVVSPSKLVKMLLKHEVDKSIIEENIESITKQFLVVKHPSNIYGFIPHELISDYYQEKIMQSLLKSKGENLKLLVLYYNSTSRCLFLTSKRSLVENAENIPKFNNLIDGSVSYGFVNKKVKSGFVLQFLEGEKSIVKSKVYSNLLPGQTLIANCKFDEKNNKKRFDCGNVYQANKKTLSELRDEAMEIFDNYLHSYNTIVENTKLNLKVNMEVEGKIGFIKEYGVLIVLKGLNTSSNVTGFLKNEHMKEDSSKYQVGESIKMRIIDIDPVDNIVYLTDVSTGGKIGDNNQQSYFEKNKNKEQSFKIELFHDNYFSLCLENYPLIKAVMPCNLYNFNYEASQLSDMFKIGDIISSKITNYNSAMDKLILEPSVKLLSKIQSLSSSTKDKTKNQISAGNVVKGRINGVKGTHVYVYIDKNTIGRIHFNDFKGDLEEIKEKVKSLTVNSNLDMSLSKKSSTDAFPEELKIKCKILHVEQKKDITICDLTNENVDSQFNSLMNSESRSKVLDTSGEKANMGIISKVDIYNKFPINIDFATGNNKIQIHFSHISADKLANIRSTFRVGDTISFYSKLDKEDTFTHSLVPFSKITKSKFELEKVYSVRVLKSISGRGLVVDLASFNNHTEAFVDICEISDDLHPNPLNLYKSGTLLPARVLSFDTKANKYFVSLRNSIVDEEHFDILKNGSTLKYSKKFNYYEKIADFRNKIYKFDAKNVIEQNLVSIGYITSSSEKGVFIKLASNVIVRASLRELTDEKTTKPFLLFKPDSLVLCRVISIFKPQDAEDKMNINVSLRESVVKFNLTLRTKSLAHNNFYMCSIMNETDSKFEVCVVGSTFTGVLKRKNIKNLNEIKSALESKQSVVLQLVKLNKDIQPPKLRFGNLAVDGVDLSIVINSLSKEEEEKNRNYAELYNNVKMINEKYKEDEENDELKELEKNADNIDFESLVKVQDEDDNDEDEDGEKENDNDNESDDEDIEQELIESDEEQAEELLLDHNVKSQFLKGLGINISNMGMEVDEEENQQDDNEQEEIVETTKNLKSSKKREKDHLKEEILTREKENSTTKMEDTQSVEYYEKQILCDPNNSLSWIQYAAYILDKLNLTSARKIFERAITTINISLSKEKMNMWIAYMNLENSYGTQETFKSVVERALEVNDKKIVYKHLISIYKLSGKYELAYEVYKIVLKNYFADFALWKSYIEFLFELDSYKSTLTDPVKINKFEMFIQPKEGLNRALQVLNKSKHVEMNVSYGQLQYKFNFIEEARNTFESILKNYPKRSDIWIVYIDKEIKHTKDVEKVRGIFEKLLTVDLKIKILKTVIKKYLEFEREYGNAKSIEYVKNLTQKLIMEKMSELKEGGSDDEMQVDDQ